MVEAAAKRGASAALTEQARWRATAAEGWLTAGREAKRRQQTQLARMSDMLLAGGTALSAGEPLPTPSSYGGGAAVGAGAHATSPYAAGFAESPASRVSSHPAAPPSGIGMHSYGRTTPRTDLGSPAPTLRPGSTPHGAAAAGSVTPAKAAQDAAADMADAAMAAAMAAQAAAQIAQSAVADEVAEEAASSPWHAAERLALQMAPIGGAPAALLAAEANTSTNASSPLIEAVASAPPRYRPPPKVAMPSHGPAGASQPSPDLLA